MSSLSCWRKSIAAVAMAGLLALALPASAQIWTGAGSEDDLRYRLSVIDAELADIRARLGVAQSGGSSGGSLGGDAIVRLDRLEAELRQLTGNLEQMQFEQRRIGEEAAQRFSDIEFRLTELEGGDISSVQPVKPLGGGNAGQSFVAGPEVSISERGDLERAINDVKQGRFDLGEDRLRTFLTTYPGSPLRGEAFYWMGESQFVRGAFQNAARSYLEGYNADRTVPTGPRNLYRLGVTLGRLGQRSEACLTLREVRTQFPTGPGDILGAADQESRSLNCG